MTMNGLALIFSVVIAFYPKIRHLQLIWQLNNSMILWKLSALEFSRTLA